MYFVDNSVICSLLITFHVNCHVLNQTDYQNQSKFFAGKVIDFCLINCGKDQHTMCENVDFNSSDSCGDRFHEYPIEGQMKKDILNGHNGIRNRVAGLMEVSNMVMLEWDDQLAKMATIWARNCNKYDQDPCTQLSPNVEDDAQSYTLVNQNMAYVKSRFLPPNLITSIIRGWYLEKYGMTPPIVYEDEKGSFKERNNFTQLVWAQTNSIGCALVRYDGGYQLVCNYFPFDMGKRSAFHIGLPCSLCPNDYALCDVFFTNLCTRGHSNQTTLEWKLSSFLLFTLVAITLKNFNF